MVCATLAIDFGTSNSAAAILENGAPRCIAIEAGADTLPTAVFFPTDSSEMYVGEQASSALIAGEEGRYMRALKSVLGTSLFHEERMVGGKRQTLAQIVTAFLKVLKTRAENTTGDTYTHALSGRPVHFHTKDAARDAKAKSDLEGCYLAAGFETVSFMFEPEAAALASQHLNQTGGIGLIVDIGGGTSDFTVFRTNNNQVEILASHGIRLGGTDFDQAVSMDHAMPCLGYGGQLRRSFGAGLLPVPNTIFGDLSTWAKIPFLYTRDTERAVLDMVRHAVEPEKLSRLAEVIEHNLGHELAFAVEAGKIAANNGDKHAHVAMHYIEPGLSVAVTPDTLNAALASFRVRLNEAMVETLQIADTPADQIASIILVGGSSLMELVSTEASAVCPIATVSRAAAFTAVVDGLAIATAQK